MLGVIENSVFADIDMEKNMRFCVRRVPCCINADWELAVIFGTKVSKVLIYGEYVFAGWGKVYIAWNNRTVAAGLS